MEANNNVKDFSCLVCLSILLEPIKLPCKHELCKPCFEKNLEVGNFTCPVCRLRYSSWARKNRKRKTLVDQHRWSEVKRAFPEKVQKRIAGCNSLASDDESFYDNDRPSTSSTCEPGEIKREFEASLTLFRNELAKEKKLQEQAGEQLALKLQAEEQEIFRKGQDEYLSNLARDFLIAKQLQEVELQNSSSIVKTEEMDEMNLPDTSKLRSTSVESHDSITAELCHFKPIKAAPLTPPKQESDGQVSEPLLIQTVARKLDLESSDKNINRILGNRLDSLSRKKQYSGAWKLGTSSSHIFPADLTSNPKRKHSVKKSVDQSYKENYPLYQKKSIGNRYQVTSPPPKLEEKTSICDKDFSSEHSSEGEDEEKIEEDESKKKVRLEFLPDSTSQHLLLEDEVPSSYSLRKMQEDRDHLLAMKLQKEFDSSVPAKRVNRQKGSGNEYMLRKR